MGTRNHGLLTILKEQDLESERPFLGCLWTPHESHIHEDFVPLDASVYNVAVHSAANTVPVADYSQWLATIVGRIDKLSVEVGALSAKLFQVLERVQDQPTTRMLAVHGLGSEKYSLRKPLLVTMEHYADEVVARLPDFDMYASAENEADALALLRHDLIDLYEDLLEGEAELGGLPASWLRDLRDYIEERAKVNG
jgi:hypothetical protein